jgi:16S rRNA (guanine(1405)-N(7))-methyltransferase
MKITESLIHKTVEQIQQSRKYRQRGLNRATIEHLILQEAPRFDSRRKLLKAVRRKLHNIVAPYLGEPDYDLLSARLAAIENPAPDSPQLKAFCLDVLREHASTAERIPHMDVFYEKIFEMAGRPKSILDLACGLHPLSFPWMELPATTRYIAYDIIQPRIDFLNAFFTQIGLAPLATSQDILANPPEISAELAFFFKEAHRFEKRQPGSNRGFWRSLRVDVLAISLPAQDLSGSHDRLEQNRALVRENLPRAVEMREVVVGNEMLFLIQNPGGD